MFAGVVLNLLCISYQDSADVLQTHKLIHHLMKVQQKTGCPLLKVVRKCENNKKMAQLLTLTFHIITISQLALSSQTQT